MIKEYRDSYNLQFTNEKYNKFLLDIENDFNYKPGFRIAETPIFIPQLLKERLTKACSDIISVIHQPNFKELTKEAINYPSLHVPGEDDESKFVQLDFGICKDENGDLTPKLIELQGFPSLYFYQDYISQKYKEHFDIPDRFSVYLNGLKRADYVEMLRQIIVGDADPRQVILLEIEPEKQATRIDFLCTERALGIKTVCISEVIKQGRELFYIDDTGSRIKILKIYNRIIFDELDQRNDLKRAFDFKDDLDVEWVGHPNWFFRISKYTMPLLSGEYVPKSFYLDRLNKYPDNLKDYVLKPLFSFAGSGVQLNVTRELLDSVKNKSNFILQEKVKYEPIIETPDIPAKCEIRMMALFNKKENKLQIVSNLARLSKGEMIGVKYNKDKEWVGGSIGYFTNDAI